MLISLNWLSDFVKTNKTPAEIADKITLSLSEVERIIKTNNDTVFEIENKALTHRPDCFSHLGLAFEVAAFFDLSSFDPLPDLNKIKPKPEGKEQPIKVKLIAKDLCSRYCAITLTDLKVGQSPNFIKERLKNCGIRPINNIVDITNYVMLETGQPLHAFDCDKVRNRKIVVRRAKKRESLATLDKINRQLKDEILVIADSKKPIALAGIMGGKETEVSNQTRTIIIESANFDPVITRKSSKILNLRTEAQTRFEKNLDPNLCYPALIRAVKLLKKYAGAKIASNVIDIYPQKTKPIEITTTFTYLNSLLGLQLKKEEIISLLKRLRISVKEDKDKLIVKPPTLRRDLRIPADVVEEVARIYGYDNIPTTLPSGVIKPPPVNLSLFFEKNIKCFLKGLGFTEVNLSSFLGEEIIKQTGGNPNFHLKLINPISPEKKYLRQTLLQGLLLCSQKNLRFFEKFSIFEIGRVFLPTEKNKMPKEIKTLSAILTDKSFYEVKGILEALFENLNIAYPLVSEISSHGIFQSGRSAKIGEFGLFGEIKPKLKNFLKTKKQVVAFELNFDKLVKNAGKITFYQPIPLYPPLIEDFSFVFEKKPPLDEVLLTIKNINPLISEAILLDYYQKTITFRISFQDPKESLSSEKVQPIRKEIINQLKNKFQAKTRGHTPSR